MRVSSFERSSNMTDNNNDGCDDNDEFEGGDECGKLCNASE